MLENRVKRGVQFLNKNKKGWFKKIKGLSRSKEPLSYLSLFSQLDNLTSSTEVYRSNKHGLHFVRERIADQGRGYRILAKIWSEKIAKLKGIKLKSK